MKLLGELGGADVPLRPLLSATAAAAATAAIYWWSKGGDTERRRTEEDTSPGPVCDPDGETALVHPTDVPQSQVMTEAVAKKKKAEEIISQLEKEKTSPRDEVKILQDTVQELKNLLCETNRDNHKLQEDYEREQETHSKLQTEYNELKNIVMHNESLQKVSLNEVLEKEQKAEEIISQQESEKTILKDEVKTLRDTVQEMGILLCEINRENDKLQEDFENQKETHSKLQMEYNELKKSVERNEELQKLSLDEADEKGQNAEETIPQLESETSSLRDEVKTLRDTVQEMGILLFETNKDYNDLQEEFENQKETHSKLQMEYNELKKSVVHNEELQKGSPNEAEEIVSQLESEKTSLSDEVQTLRDTVQKMRIVGHEINKEWNEIMKEFESEEEAYTILMKMVTDMKETFMEKEVSQELLTTDEEKKHEKAAETIVELECENVHLNVEVKTLWESVQEMGNLLCESNKDYNKLMEEFESFREAHSILQIKYQEFKTNVMHEKESLQVSVEEAVEKLKAAEEMVGLLKNEKCDLSNEVLRLRDSLDTGNLLFETNRDLRQELEKEREAYCVLQREYHNLKNSHRVSLAESEEVKMLRCTLEEMGNLLAESNSDCDELKEEVEKEREANLVLQFEYDELKNTLMRYEDFLKVYESKYKEKHEEVFAQMVNKNVSLTEELTMKHGEVEDMENLYINTNKDCYKLLEEFRKERVAHSRLQSEHNQMMKAFIHSEEALIKEFESMQDAHNVLQAQHEELIKTIMQNEDLLQEYEREQEAHSVLQFKYDELMKDIMEKQEQMKVFLDEAMKHQKKYEETIARLSNDKLDLIDEVKFLLLCDTHLEYNRLKKEFENQIETHSKLQMEYNELKKSVMHNEELQKVFQPEAEENEKTAEEIISQLKMEISLSD